jgi:hypothetical protein
MASLLLFPPVSFPLLVGWVLERSSKFLSILFEMDEIFYINLKNKIKQNYFILNLGLFLTFQLNFGWNVSVSFYMFHSGLEKSLNQIEPDSI